MSESNKDNFGKKIFNVFIVLISFGVSFLVLFLITSYGVKNFLQQNETMEKPKITESSLCSRSESYEIAPEFIRAISIVKQKMTFEDDFLSDFENCINVQYDQLKSGEDGPEGVFLFDSSISSLNDLKIFVDNSYKNEDDYMTAVLSVHEITHAKQFYENSNLSCVEKEVHAFWNEFLLCTKLNEGERKSILSRVYNPLHYPSPDKNIRQLEAIFDYVDIAAKSCGNDMDCRQKETVKLIRKQIEESPYYQEQCKSN